MQIIDGWTGAGAALRGATAAMGNFDGVHLGHRALIEAAGAEATRRGAPLGALTFEPHPRRFFRPDSAPFRLTTPEEKARQIAALGVDAMARLPFDETLSSMAPETFVAEVLAGGLGLSHIAVGADFRFGHKRAGDADALRRLAEAHGIGTTIIHLEGGDEGEYASTSLRILVEEGRCAEAAAQLGRWHAVTGEVRKGDQRGRDLGYPTANLDFGEQILPRFGVYACRVEILDGPHKGIRDGVASLGERPTFGINAPNFEVHLFDFAGDLYGTPIAAGLVAYQRAEIAYTGPEALIAQMDADAAEARRILAAARLPGEAQQQEAPCDP